MRCLMKLRQYQTDAIKALDKEVSANRSSLLCLPTGAGKTFSAAKFIYDKWIKNAVYPVFWTAHLGELLTQAEETFKKIDPKINILHWNAKSKPDIKDIKPGTIVFCSIQATRSFYWSGEKAVLIIDEAHREAAKSYREFEKKLTPVHKIGLTATPSRFDKKTLGFDSVAYSTTLMKLANDGFLSKPKYVRVATKLKFDMATNASDFTKASLADLGKSLARIDIIAQEYIDNSDKYGQTLIFMPSRKSAKELTALLKKKGVDAESLDGEDDKLHRKLTVQDFNKGNLQVLVNVQLFTEGFDAPETRSIFMARPTLSNVLWSQAAGRGARKTKTKDFFYFVDFIDDVTKYPLLAESWSCELLGAPETERMKKEKENEKATEEALEKVDKPEEEKLIKNLSKEAKVQDLVAVCTVTSWYRKKLVTKSYPIFKEDYVVFKSFSSLVATKYKNAREEVPSLLWTSYERGGHKTALSRKDWHAFAWSLKRHYDVKFGTRQLNYEPIHNTIVDSSFKSPKVDLSIFCTKSDVLDQKAVKEKFEELMAKRRRVFIYSHLDYKTIFVLPTTERWYFYKKDLEILEKQLIKEFKDPQIWIKTVSTGLDHVTN